MALPHRFTHNFSTPGAIDLTVEHQAFDMRPYRRIIALQQHFVWQLPYLDQAMVEGPHLPVQIAGQHSIHS